MTNNIIIQRQYLRLVGDLNGLILDAKKNRIIFQKPISANHAGKLVKELMRRI
ncbi:MAG: hypothetical protein ACJA0S_000741 [Rickettsiales bacterium]|jgi:hypothetical protein